MKSFKFFKKNLTEWETFFPDQDRLWEVLDDSHRYALEINQRGIYEHLSEFIVPIMARVFNHRVIYTDNDVEDGMIKTFYYLRLYDIEGFYRDNRVIMCEEISKKVIDEIFPNHHPVTWEGQEY